MIGLLLILVIWLSFVAHQVLSWRRATGDQRQQLKWLATGAAVTLVVIAASFAISSTSVAGELLGIGLAALPVGIGVGILKYRSRAPHTGTRTPVGMGQPRRLRGRFRGNARPGADQPAS